jgi:hypothetical protein
MNILKFVIIFVISVSCSLLDQRDYEDQMLDQYTESMFEPRRDFPVIAGDTGVAFMSENELKSRTPASFEQKKSDLFDETLERELIMLEASLDEVEAQKYVLVKNKLGGASSRIYYLRMHPMERDSYLHKRKISPSYTYEYKGDLPPANPVIGLGMDKREVISSWGRPINTQFSGDPMQENEKWSYMRRGRMRYLYFENGRVQGWSD